MPGLSSSMWTLSLRHVGSSSLTSDWTQAPCIGSTGVLVTAPPGSPKEVTFHFWWESAGELVKNTMSGTSQVVYQLRLSTPNPGGLG